MNLKLATAALCLTPFLIQAEEQKETSPMKASAEFGALFKTGDTKSGDLKAGLDFSFEKNQWRSSLNFDVLVRKTETEVVKEDGTITEEFETSDQKWTIVGQTNYTIEPNGKNYVYGNASYADNRFSSFDNQSSISSGWGRRWFETKKATLDADVGPGYKRDVLKEPDENGETTHDAFIIQAQALYKRKINEHVEFKQLVVAKYAPKNGANSTYKAESSITTKLIETLQLKFSFIVEHNTDVDENKENTNTQTAMTLVYSF
ncbi:DUF481 domain-containing protein [Thalassotalea hakodatensis]|uniref:DUF481 domain-containing protein n=1 Tax=Thalassotalea hakodatensis TaxID=3030492 RepID=UPI0025728A4E|nr:DUF481 domain-containing protein [Thalassotalea hakodatensis]